MQTPISRPGYMWERIAGYSECTPSRFRNTNVLEIKEYARYIEVEIPVKPRFSTKPPKRVAALRPFGVATDAAKG